MKYEMERFFLAPNMEKYLKLKVSDDPITYLYGGCANGWRQKVGVAVVSSVARGWQMGNAPLSNCDFFHFPN